MKKKGDGEEVDTRTGDLFAALPDPEKLAHEADLLRLGHSTGPELRDEGAESVLEHATREWRERASRSIGHLARSGKDFTSEDVRELAGDPPHHPNALPAAMLAAVKAGSIVFTGRIAASTRPNCHAAMLKVWRGA